MTSSVPDSGGEFPWRVAVIGGGVSGLAAAHRLMELCQTGSRPLALTLFEAGSRLGGTVETRTIDSYLVECGADSFITSRPWLTDVCRRVGLDDEIISTNVEHRRSLVLYRGKPVEVPAGFMLLTPARLGTVLTSPLLSPSGKIRTLMEAVIPARRDNADESLATFVRRRFGKELWERLVQPLVGGIYTADPERLSVLATVPRFRDMERRHGSLIRAARRASPEADADGESSGARYGLFATLKRGLSTLVTRLRERIQTAALIRLNTAVTSIRRDAQHDDWEVGLSNGPAESFDAVVLALPTYRASRILEAVDATLAEELARIEYASSAVVVTGHKLTDAAHPLDAFGLVIPQIEHRTILAVSFSSRKFPGRAPGGRVQLRTFVGGALQPEQLQKSDGELIALVREELADILGVHGTADFAHVSRYDRAMPQYHVGHLERVAAIAERVARFGGLELVGNAYRGVGLPDCIHSGEQAAEKLVAERFPGSNENRQASQRQESRE